MFRICCAKFGHILSPIYLYVFTTSFFLGSVWSVVRSGWTFDIGFKCGHGLPPISMVLFLSGDVMD